RRAPVPPPRAVAEHVCDCVAGPSGYNSSRNSIDPALPLRDRPIAPPTQRGPGKVSRENRDDADDACPGARRKTGCGPPAPTPRREDQGCPDGADRPPPGRTEPGGMARPHLRRAESARPAVLPGVSVDGPSSGTSRDVVDGGRARAGAEFRRPLPRRLL